jgi:hypothetical protein
VHGHARTGRARAAPARPRRRRPARRHEVGSAPSPVRGPEHRDVGARAAPSRGGLPSRPSGPLAAAPPRRGRRRRARRRRRRSRRCPGTFSAPARGPAPGRPPTSTGRRRRPRRTSSAADPGGPPSLWALTLSRSAPRRRSRSGTGRRPGAASDVDEHARSRLAATTSATGWSVPTSWLPDWTWTSAVPGSMAAASASGSTRPRRSTPTTVTRWRAAASRTHRCSTAGRTTWSPRSVAIHVAVTTDSVAPLVKTTSRDLAPTSSATCSRATSTATRAAWPSLWTRPGSAVAANQGSMASTAPGRVGDVDAWSR